MVRTLVFHINNTGSNPVGDITKESAAFDGANLEVNSKIAEELSHLFLKKVKDNFPLIYNEMLVLQSISKEIQDTSANKVLLP